MYNHKSCTNDVRVTASSIRTWDAGRVEEEDDRQGSSKEPRPRERNVDRTDRHNSNRDRKLRSDAKHAGTGYQGHQGNPGQEVWTLVAVCHWGGLHLRHQCAV